MPRNGNEQRIDCGATTNRHRNTYQAPAGRKSRTISTADKDGVVHVPNRRLAVARLVKDIVWLAIAVKVTCRHQFPAAGESRTVGTSDKYHAGQIPDRRLARAAVKQCVIRVAVAIKI